MLSIPIGGMIVVVLFGTAMAAMALSRMLPQHHLTQETQNVVTVSVAVVGTLAALVLGLLISTSNASFSLKQQGITQASADLIQLDRVLRRYGPEAVSLRTTLRQYAAARLQNVFPDDPNRHVDLTNGASASELEDIQDGVLLLTASGERQSWLRAQALQLTNALLATRWQVAEEDTNHTPAILQMLVLFWFVVIFASFGLFAPRNLTVVAMIFLCALAVGSAIRMTAELQTPFDGLIRVSSAPLRQALQVISQ